MTLFMQFHLENNIRAKVDGLW